MRKIILSTMGAIAIGLSGMAMAPTAAEAGIALGEDGKLKLGGTVRVRAEHDKRFDDGRTRLRYRLRLRLNGTYQADENWSLGFRLATNSGTANSPHQTFGTISPGSNTDFGLDRAYIKYQNGGLGVWGGKKGLNFHELTEVWWDEDLQPEGFGLTYKGLIDGLTINGGYFQLNDTGWADIGEGYVAMYQGVYSTKMGGVKVTLAGGGGSLLDTGATYAANRAGVGSLLIKGSGWRVGAEYIKSNSRTEDTAYTIQARYKLPYGIGLRAYYYHVEAFSVLLDGRATQDNFSTPSGDGGVTNFKGTRFQIDYKFNKKTSLDLRWYHGEPINTAVLNPGGVATTYVLGQKRDRYQANLNVKF